MKKSIFLMTFLLTFTFTVPAFAATSSPIKVAGKIVWQGNGQTVTIPDNGESVKKKQPINKQAISPNYTTSYTMSQGGSGTFNGSTWDPYSDGYLEDASAMTVTDQHNLFSNDYLWANGVIESYWSGNNPMDATSIIMKPSQVISSTEYITGISVPAGFSVSPSGVTGYINWAQTNPTPGYEASDYWDQWEVSSGGYFTNVSTNDEVLWQFGSATTSEMNTVSVAIQ